MAYPSTLETLTVSHADNAAEVIRAADINDLARIENSLMRKVGFGFSEPTGANQILAGNVGSTAWQTFLPLGTNPAASGQIRLPNNVGINWRNAANGADLGIKLNASDQLELGAPLRLANNVSLFARNAAGSGDVALLKLNSSDAVEFGTALITAGDSFLNAVVADRFFASATSWNPPDGKATVISATMTARGVSDTTDQAWAFRALAKDHTGVSNVTITAMSRSGTTITATASGIDTSFDNGDKVSVYGVTHTFNAEVNGSWAISNVTTNTFDFTVPGISSGSYTSGGTVTNRPYLGGFLAEIDPHLARGGLFGGAANGDDANGFAVQNVSGVSTAKATDAFYVAASPSITNQAWFAGFNNDAKVDVAFRAGGTTYLYGIDLAAGAYSGSGVPLRLPNAKSVVGRNNANNADISLFQFTSGDQLQFQTTLNFGNGVTVVLGTGSGSMIGSAPGQKLGLWGATPVAQHSATGETVGFTAGGGTTATDASTFTGNVGTKAYRMSDVVKALKNAGIMAAS